MTRPRRVLLLRSHPDDGHSMIRYSEELERALRALDVDVTVLSPSAVLSRRAGGRAVKAARYVEKLLLFPVRIGIATRRRRFDWVHVTDHSNAPWLLVPGTGARRAVTVHDLIAQRAAAGELPEHRPRWSGRLYQRLIAAGLSRATDHLSVSETTRADAEARFPGRRHRLLHNPVPSPSPVRAASPARTPYAMIVSTGGWRKTRWRAIEMCLRLRTAMDDELEAILVGPPLDPEELARVPADADLASWLEVRSDVTEDALADLYAGAFCLVQASRYEGFGWPIVEANAFGVPAVVADEPVFREVGGPAAIVPQDLDGDWSAIVRRLSSAPARDAARRNADRFTRERFTTTLDDLLGAALDDRGSDATDRRHVATTARLGRRKQRRHLPEPVARTSSAEDERTDVLFIAPQPVSAADHGGGVRAAGIAGALAASLRLGVLHGGPALGSDGDADGDAHDGFAWTASFPARGLRTRDVLSRGSAEGLAITSGLPEHLVSGPGGPGVVYWSDSVLASSAMQRFPPHVRHVVEFANIEHQRYASMASRGEIGLRRRVFFAVEAVKALLWERTVCRRADLVVVLTEADRRRLPRWSRPLVVPNGTALGPPPEESDGSTVLTVGSWWYEPNATGLRQFIARDWAGVRERVPGARLVVAGRGGEVFADADRGIDAAGFVADLGGLYSGAALVLAPARTGGGSQLKVVAALERGRIVVGPPLLLHEAAPYIAPGSVVASPDLAPAITRLLLDRAERARIEAEILRARPGMSWPAVTEALRSAVGGLVRGTLADGGGGRRP